MIAIGVVLPSREAVMAGHADPALVLAAAEAAEAASFDSIWIGDSPFHRPRFDPLTALAAVAARTTRVTLGTAILLPALRNPVLLAHQVATVDRLAAGRLVLGVGAGWVPAEFEAAGVPFGERLRRMLATVHTMRALWRGDHAAAGSPYWDAPPISPAPGPARPGGPPVWTGGAGPRVLRAAGREMDGWMPTSATPEAFAAGWDAVRAAAVEVGRDPAAITPAVYLTVLLDEDRARAEGRMAAYAEAYYGIPYDVMHRFQGYYAGDAEGCVEWLAAFVEAGARHLVLRFATTEPLGQIERAAAEVLRALRRM